MRASLILFVWLTSSSLAQDGNVNPSRGKLLHDKMLRDQRIGELRYQFESAKKIKNDQDLSLMLPRPLYGYALDDLSIGQVRRIDANEFRVLQVLGETECLLKCSDLVLLLRNYPTKDLATNDRVYVLGFVKIGITRTYKTAFGTNTVYTFQLVNKEVGAEWAAKEHKAKEDREKLRAKMHDEMKEKIRLKDFETYHSKAGTEVLAKFIRYAGGKVQLETSDGRTIHVALSAFTQEDADKLRELIKESRSSKRKKDAKP